MKHVMLYLVWAAAAIAATKETKLKLPNSRADLVTGEQLFKNHCALCHGLNGGVAAVLC